MPEDVMALISKLNANAAAKKEPLTGEEVRIEEARLKNAQIGKPAPAVVVKPIAPTPDRPSTHIKEQFGGNVSDIPVGHAYHQRRRK